MSYSYHSSSSSRAGGPPRSSLSNDAEFQAAKMQAMMGAPLAGTGGSSYSYRTSSNSSTPTALNMDAEMRRMEREMDRTLHTDPQGVSSSYSTTRTGGLSSPTAAIPIQQEPSSGRTVRKVVTTTSTKTDPDATRELERLERDFSRIGRTPDAYDDDFDKLKREITTGDAYRDSSNISSPHRLHKTPSLGSQHQTTTTTTTTYDSSSGNRSHPDSSEVFIPVRTYDNTFDDFHMNRWQDHRDHFGSVGASDLDAQKVDWENRLRGVKSDMFKLSPHSDFGSSTIESSRAVSKNPLGNPEFSIQFDMRDFKADDISLSTKNGKLLISATHEDKIGKSTSRREFTRSVDLPADIQISMMRSVFSRDGILSITAPIKPPHYDPLPKPALQSGFNPDISQASFDSSQQVSSSSSYHSPEPRHTYAPATICSPQSSSQVSPKYNTSLSHSSSPGDSHKPMDYTVPVSGYSPEEITVSIESQKVKVHGKHVESRIGGRKVHNEFTKLFDLPASVDPRDVRCYIKEGHTLHVIAHVGEDITGLVHFLSINKKN